MKRGRGKPRLEETLDPMWKDIMIESGKEGKHITDYLIKLGISWQSHYNLLERNPDYVEAFNQYQKFCEEWWYNKAYESVKNNESTKFNQRLWTIIMKNKFRDNWKEEKNIDITSKDEKINSLDPIQIEIIKSESSQNKDD